MNLNAIKRSRGLTSLAALAATAATAAALAAPAGAASGSGEAAIIPANHDKGRTLSGQGVKLLAGTGATAQNGTLGLPIGELNPGSKPTAASSGSFSFKRGKRSVALTGIHFDLTAGTLVGTLGGTEVPVFWLGAAPTVNGTTGSITLSAGKLRLTADAATALREKLGLERALVRKGVGTIWLAAKANPTHAAAQAVVSGATNWGVLASWRKYVLGNFGPGSVGTITPAGGVTANGTLSEPGAYFGFPAASGSYRRGLYGAADKLSLKTSGSLTFAKPGHCIVEVKLAELELTIDGANSSLVSNSKYDIDKVAGMTCLDEPAVALPGLQFATLDAGGIVPTYSAGGKTITWTGIPAKLTAAASPMFGGLYPAGKELDLVSISVAIG